MAAPPATGPDRLLWLDASGLALRALGPGAPGPVRCDFAGGGARHRRLYGGGRSQAIARATGLKTRKDLFVADLTAGLGGDAFVLAGLGARVAMVERHPVVAALLADGLARARKAAGEDPALGDILGRLSLAATDARHWLKSLAGEAVPDVIYLDPMFPERKKSARVRKSMALFQGLVGEDGDAHQVLTLALDRARHRVVVKRPSHAPALGGREPGYSLKGKSVRFDIYPLRKI